MSALGKTLTLNNIIDINVSIHHVTNMYIVCTSYFIKYIFTNYKMCTSFALGETIS